MAGAALNPWASHITEREPEIKSKHRSTCQLHKLQTSLWLPHYITGQTGSSVSPTTRSTGYARIKPLGLDIRESRLRKQSIDGIFFCPRLFLNLVNGLNLVDKADGCFRDQVVQYLD